MDQRREKNYKEFNDAFANGLKEIAKAKEVAGSSEEREEHVEDICDEQYERLKQTAYGQKLCADEGLERLILDLDFGLRRMLERMLNDPKLTPPPAVIEWVNGAGLEREFLFLGGVGRIFRTFRDEPCIFDTTREREERKALCIAADEVIRRSRTLLDHATVRLVYPKKVAEKIVRASIQLEDLLPQLTPLSMAHDFSVNPFQRGVTIIVNQFSQAVCLLAFEVFGWITPRVLDSFLEMKSSTAAEFGLTPWVRTEGKSAENRKRDLRRYVEKSLKDVLVKSAKPEQLWVTRDFIAYFDANRDALIRDDDGAFLG